MSGSPSSPKATASFPDRTFAIASSPAESPYIQTILPALPCASPSSSESERSSQSQSPRPSSRRPQMDRPCLGDRQRSSSIIVPKGRDVIQRERPEYPPSDARTMSPRRNGGDIERLERGVRESLKEQARSLQSSLAALAEKIDGVKSDHDKLESENRFLQDYIGGLTRTMSRDNLGREWSGTGTTASTNVWDMRTGRRRLKSRFSI